MTATKPHHIIAIGASAGGLDEINSFFDHTPLDGVSYVIVQHLSSDFKSRMVELLSKHSKLRVKEAQNNMTVQSNEVYLIPNDKYMTIEESKLRLTDKTQVKGPHLTINKFFNSLAKDCGPKAIGVVLSGLGSDGTEGIVAIKNAGGMVIARDPETSEFASMPAHAIATGMVDFVLEPALMPNIIDDYVTHEQELISENKDDDKAIGQIIEIIKDQSPHDFTDYKRATIIRRIKRRAATNNFAKLDDFITFLKINPKEVEGLAQDFLISVTSFFRDKEAFEYLQNTVVPEIFAKLNPSDEIKIWVCGCATGEEAYSIAMLIAEWLTGKFKDTIVKIFATDIDTVALVHAGKGIYNHSIEKDISPDRLKRFFTKSDENYKVKTEIRKMLIFAQHDLVKHPPYCNMNFISCRNLLIYMTPALQKRIFLMLLFGLKTEGFLFLGSSENPMPIIEHLEVMNKKWKIYKNIETKRAINFEGFALPQMIDIKYNRSLATRDIVSPKHNGIIGESVYSTLLNDMGYLAVCVDENNHVIKTYGDTTRFLLQKNFNLNLSELLPRALAVAFNTISTTVKQTNEKITANAITFKHGTENIKVNLTISPLVTKTLTQKLFMVTFFEDKLMSEADKRATLFDEKIYVDKYTLMIEEELIDLKEKLHSTYEQLDASNDNMQAYNEELLSANEEMQSANEEMQSVNEELHTINADYQLKNKELQEVNDDLNNYFRSSIQGQLFVNNDLLLMKYSPGTVKLINLLPNDIGRPLSNISTNIKLETLTEDIKKVLADGVTITKEIETNNGMCYQATTMPYIQKLSNKKNGAIITFNDVTELKKTQEELAKKNKSLLRINDDLNNFVLTASHDLLAPLGNIELSIEVMNEIKVADPALNKSLNVINSSVKKFRSLIQNISLIAKMESEMMTMEMVDIEEVLNDIEWSLNVKMQTSGAVINREIETNKIYFSKKNLRSILYNVISNSLKFKTEMSPVITISTLENEDMFTILIKDNGIGISIENQDKIFDIYGRLNHYVEGQGIGLYLAKKIIVAAGGNIIVESKVGEGCTIIIQLKTNGNKLIGK